MKQYECIGKGNTSKIYDYGENKIIKLYKSEISKDSYIREFCITKNILGINKIIIYDKMNKIYHIL
ncbi:MULTISPECIES: hypothetical protein [unclassified Clostridioides]|uniref:hypothetical protein n=1 Tax=unclassified Clostridioides TaxID=2635829 RepID=UPI001D0C5804|nr:hypothetical protein [Clostridioides sp. ES-S-0001-02]MCC0640038.1 hypothetical protein [Clostridioides sp. ES-S-0049-03]MCC0674741.1 hypothetical protein [Clostridioides sp. ES-W-0018-02]MCC0697711.1 hypothetical protein [Clostridioides sp. ES-S-0048-02]MCC0710444.1 hypothetical protein [Clostridioides sp. ES-W-0017-02]MCC0762076.1 hypothetical protein [Clostridioides sp. ES-S-0006-03]UDN56893.1 hypothetical protein JJC01_11965 [Clostridioides sp. ES-S-0010-02]